MKYICIVRDTGALGYTAPTPTAKNYRQTCGTILQAVGKVTNLGVTYYVVIAPKTIFIPTDQAVIVEQL